MPLTEVLQDQPEPWLSASGRAVGWRPLHLPIMDGLTPRAKQWRPPWLGSSAPARQVPRWNHPSRLRVDEPKPQLANREPRDGS